MKYLNRTIEYGLYLLVFLLPVQTRWIIKAGEFSGGYSDISLYVTDVLLIILLILAVFNALRKQGLQIMNYESMAIWRWIVGLDLMIFISIFSAQDKLLALYKYGIFLLGIGLFWLITRVDYSKVKLLGSLLAGIILQAGLAVWQFLTQSDFASKWLGMAMHDASVLGASVVETLNGERWLRAYGGLDHPNVLGGVLAIGSLFLIGRVLISKPETQEQKDTRIQDTRNKQIQNSKNFLLLTFYFLLLTSLVFTFSRGAWAGFAVGLFVMLIAAIAQRNLFRQKILLEMILASGILVFIFFNLFGNLVAARLSVLPLRQAGAVRLENKSKVERMESYKSGWDIIKKHWLFGAGIGNYVLRNENQKPSPVQRSWAGSKTQPRSAKLGGVKNPAPFSEAGRGQKLNQPVHNVFLLVLAETGTFGLLFFAGILLCVMRYALCEKKWTEAAILIAAITMFFADHWLWSLHFGVLFFWMILGLVVRFKIKVVSRK